MTVTLILVPLIAAAVVGFLPIPRAASEGLALLAALVELVLAAVALVRFDVGGGSQFVTDLHDFTITDALGTTAPAESVTRPVRLALLTCADTCTAIHIQRSVKQKIIRGVFIVNLLVT